MKPTTERPARIRSTTVLETPGFWGTVTHTTTGLWLTPDFPIDAEPLVMTRSGSSRRNAAGARSWPVGTRFWYIGSRNTSAGFESLDFRAFEPLTYVGLCHAFDDVFACFTLPGKPGFYAWHHCGGEFVWGTPCCSGRVISMDRYLTELPSGVCEWMPLPLLSKQDSGSRRRKKARTAHDDEPEDE